MKHGSLCNKFQSDLYHQYLLILFVFITLVKVLIQVFDVNDNSPVFTRDLYARKVAENVAVGTTVEVVRATDADVGRNGHVRYKILAGNEASMYPVKMLVNKEMYLCLQSKRHVPVRILSFQ